MIILRGLVQILSLNSKVFLTPGIHKLVFSCKVKLKVSLKVDPQFLQQYNLANLSILVI